VRPAHVGAGLRHSFPKCSVCGDDRDVLISGRLPDNKIDDRVVAGPRRVHDPQAAHVTFVGSLPGRTFQYDNDRRLEPADVESVAKTRAEILRGLGAVAPPAVRARADNVRCVHHKHCDIIAVTVPIWPTHSPSTWPDPGVPQQLHLDLSVPNVAGLDAVHERALQLGAELRYDRSDDGQERLRVYVDPAGHPFCVFVAPN
jgi:hypothetical protein